MYLRNLFVVLTLVFLFSFGVFPQTASGVPDATDTRRIFAGYQGSGLIGLIGLQYPSNLYMQSFGDESYTSFTINWDPRQLIFLHIEKGADLPTASQITLDRSRLALGSLGITISSPTTFREGTINLANLVFISAPDPVVSGLPVTFTSNPTPQITRGANGKDLSTIYLSESTQLFFADPSTAFEIRGATSTPGQTILLPVSMSEAFSRFTGQTSFRFSIEWDSTRFSFVNASLGSGVPLPATLDLDTSQLNEGRLGLIVTGTSPLPPNSNSRNIANVRLAVSPLAGNGYFPIFFTSSPIPYAVFDAQGNPAAASSQSPGIIKLGSTTTITGVLRRPSGQPLTNTTVVLRGTQLTATTSSFGIFTFPSVPVGTGYTFGVMSKRYRFGATPIFLSSAAGVELQGLE